jgi:hypothetical protein
MLAITSPGTKRPAAEPLPGRHRQPAHSAPAALIRHEVKLNRTVGHRARWQHPAWIAMAADNYWRVKVRWVTPLGLVTASIR